MAIVTLTTDFGSGDYGAGLLHGVIWKIAPLAQVVDLSHDIPRHDVQAAARLLERCTPYFPEGTVHVAVIDPGVGTSRRPIAARLGRHYFVGPDNGVFTLLIERVRAEGGEVLVVHLDQPEYWLPKVSHIFHGRDIFAPVAAHLARGARLEELGSPIEDAVVMKFQ